MEKWSPEFFKTEFGNKPVKIQGNEIKLEDYIELINSADADNPAPLPIWGRDGIVVSCLT